MIQRIRKNQGTPDRVAGDFEALLSLVKSGEFRDYAFDADVYAGLFQLLSLACSWRTAESQPYVVKVQQIFWAMVRAPEFDVAEAEEQLGELLWSLCSRLDGSAQQAEWPFLRDILLWLYEKFPRKRAELRGVIGRPLKTAGRFVHKSAPLAPLMQVLGPIIRGFQLPLGEAQRRLLLETLLPLHKPNEWLCWDRQTPMVSMYHKELVHCMLLILEKEPRLSCKCLEAVCNYLPQSHESNTPKEVLLIAELAEIMKVMQPEDLQGTMPLLVRHMVRLFTSQNAQTLQSVLQFWKDERVSQLLSHFANQLIPNLMPMLLRDGELFWNPTVNKMTSLVLEKLEEADPELFQSTAEQLWGPGKAIPAFEAAAAAESVAPELEHKDTVKPDTVKPGLPSNIASLKFGAGSWKPGQGGGKQPPLTATGVAPWAFKGGNGAQPPVTVTGVAPWAFKKEPSAPSAPRAPRAPETGTLGSLREEEETPKSGLDRVHAYMKLCVPVKRIEGPNSWETALMEETPTLLPSLKFHNLVFGHEDIGRGAFSVVRYARTIQKEKTQSKWPEYAVKVINTKTMEELGYEASVNREICVLKMLSHPGIARMVAAFRYRDGAYLVLEYAHKGDLHNMLCSLGKLQEDVARFFVGEVVAALCAIHDTGFVYSDLKPENVVITSSNHAKLTDFGGCRPITDQAAANCRRALLKRLRDGDWRAQDAPEVEISECEEEIIDDGRVEGTMIYLPPEVVKGGVPTLASDAWALGCLLYQLLTGRPPVWADSELEEEIKSRIVSFQLDDDLASSLSPSARSLVGSLLQDVKERSSVASAAKHDFFEGLDVFALHKRPIGPDLPEIEVKPKEEGDERWQRRQFSKIWTVMPSAQDFVPPKTFGVEATATSIAETDMERGVPFGLQEEEKPIPTHRVESL